MAEISKIKASDGVTYDIRDTSKQPIGNYVTTDTAQTISGAKTLSTYLKTVENTMGLKLRTHATYETGWIYGTSGNEAVTLAMQNPVTAFQIVYGTAPSEFNGSTWQSVTPLFQTKDGKVIINRKITTTADTTNLKLFDVNGAANATTLYENGTALSEKYQAKGNYLTSVPNLASNKITLMTGYSKPNATSAVSTSDSLNAAIGKLEKALDGKGTSNLTLGTTASTAAKCNHTHTTTIATSSSTNELTLAHGTKYAITAGGDSFVFTMPSTTPIYCHQIVVVGLYNQYSAGYFTLYNSSSTPITTYSSFVSALPVGRTIGGYYGYTGTGFCMVIKGSASASSLTADFFASASYNAGGEVALIAKAATTVSSSSTVSDTVTQI